MVAGEFAMSDLEIPPDAIQIVADHCFGEAQSKDEWALDIATVALTDAAPLVVAAELRHIADHYHKEANRERARSIWLSSGSPKWQVESSISSYQELADVTKRLRARADELDPS